MSATPFQLRLAQWSADRPRTNFRTPQGSAVPDVIHFWLYYTPATQMHSWPYTVIQEWDWSTKISASWGSTLGTPCMLRWDNPSQDVTLAYLFSFANISYIIIGSTLLTPIWLFFSFTHWLSIKIKYQDFLFPKTEDDERVLLESECWSLPCLK